MAPGHAMQALTARLCHTVLLIIVVTAWRQHNFASRHNLLSSFSTPVSRHQSLRRYNAPADEYSSTTKSEEALRVAMKESRESIAPDVTFTNMSSESISDFGDFDAELLNSLKLKRSYASILTERVMQTIDDYQLSSSIKKIPRESVVQLRGSNAPQRPRIVVLGTGWGGHAFLKTIDTARYDVKIISPRNYFAFTPMLAASAVGTVEFRSICEPIRNVNPLADYLEASAEDINFEEQVVSCVSVKCEGTACDIAEFDVPYDYLIVAIGATVNTFGIKGVREHCQFLKQVEDAANLRKAIANCFERANIPNLADAEIRSALSFVIVGAGPTGVEFTSELRDWLEYEGRKYYPHLLKYVKITLVEAGNAVLPVFDETLQKEALKRLTERPTKLIMDGLISEEVTQVLLKSGVKEVGDKFIEFSNGERLDYGFCVWAAGNGPMPFVLQAIDKIGEAQKAYQSKARGRFAIDNWLRIRGARNAFSIGDCTFTDESPLPATAQVASQQGSYLGRLFSKGYDMSVAAPTPPQKQKRLVIEEDAQIRAKQSQSPYSKQSTTTNVMSSERHHASPSESQLAPASITSFAAGSDIKFMSERMNIGQLGVSVEQPQAKSTRSISSVTVAQDTRELVTVEYAKPFQFLNLGVLAYIGASQALAQVAVDSKTIRSTGQIGFLLWRGVYWFKQVSWRNRILVSIDWLKARLFGRELGAL